jgi:hypothetical protein
MRREVDSILRRLLAIDARDISLDRIGDEIGAAPISQDEIEALLQHLERAGKRIGSPSMEVRRHLRPVLEQARRLKAQSHATPNVVAIAEATGLTVAEVRAALLFASVMGR